MTCQCNQAEISRLLARFFEQGHDLQNCKGRNCPSPFAAFIDKKEQEIELLLREDVGGRPRITNTKKIILQLNVMAGVKKSLETKLNV